jgi:hypothetical protein
MPAVRCSVRGCGRTLQPWLKPDPADRSSWIYPECDYCFRPVCSEHSAVEGDGQVVCAVCHEHLAPSSAPLAATDLK